MVHPALVRARGRSLDLAVKNSLHSTSDLLTHSLAPVRSTWIRLGKGSFGCVYKGEYLGIEVRSSSSH